MQLPGSSIARAVAVAIFLVAGASAAQTQPLAQRQHRVVSLKEALQLAAQKGPDVAAARAQADVIGAGVERAYTAWQPDLVATGTFDHTSAPQVFDVALLARQLGLPTPASPPPPLVIVGANSRF